MRTATAWRWRACPVETSAFAIAGTPEDRSSSSPQTSGMPLSAGYRTGSLTVSAGSDRMATDQDHAALPVQGHQTCADDGGGSRSAGGEDPRAREASSSAAVEANPRP